MATAQLETGLEAMAELGQGAEIGIQADDGLVMAAAQQVGYKEGVAQPKKGLEVALGQSDKGLEGAAAQLERDVKAEAQLFREMAAAQPEQELAAAQGDVSTERVITCANDKNNVQRLSCDSGVISVETALYGRADRETCSKGHPPQQLSNTKCSLQGTVELLRNRCNGKKVCELNINFVHTSDPCYGTLKYLETNYTCLPANYLVACEQSLAYLYCDEGQVISVYGADYGRRDRTTCAYQRPVAQIQDVTCSSPTSKVAESCNEKNSCTITAGNSVFGDPCYGTYKYLEVAYVCQYPV
ncbi:hypothetical protein INR49_004733 [Caranx melampygus]|nr:hypothetical protein INR49_004733 [Caranx melampygus]